MLSSHSPTVLVLMPTYNGQEWVDKQICSVLNQQNVHVSLLVRDDFSEDSTLEEVKKIASKTSQIELLSAKFKSGYAGKSYIDLVLRCNPEAFDYIAFCDQDDIWLPDKLSRAISYLKDSDFSGYSSSVIAFWDNGKENLLKQSSRQSDLDFIFEGAGQGCTFLFPQKIFVKIKSFCAEHHNDVKEFYYHDWLTYLLIRSWGLRWYFDKNPSVKYRQHLRNDTGSRATYFGFLKRLRMIRSGWYHKQIKIAILLAQAAACRPNNKLLKFDIAFNNSKGFKRIILVSYYTVLYGRRRLVDRFFLGLCALLGYF